MWVLWVVSVGGRAPAAAGQCVRDVWGECQRGAAPSAGVSGRCTGRQRPHMWRLHQARARRCWQGVVGVQLQAQELQELQKEQEVQRVDDLDGQLNEAAASADEQQERVGVRVGWRWGVQQVQVATIVQDV